MIQKEAIIELGFDFSSQPTVEDLITSLKAIEGLEPFVKDCYSTFAGVTKVKCETKIAGIESGSLWEKIIFLLAFEDEQHQRDFFGGIREKLLEGDAMTIGGIVGVVIGGFLVYVIVQKFGNKGINIKNSNINLNLDKESLETIYRKHAEKPGVLKAATSILSKAKDRGAGVFLNRENLLSSNEIQKVNLPLETDIKALDKELEPDSKPYFNVEIAIRATDLDSEKKGWGAIISDISPNRVPMSVNSNIPKNKVLGTIWGDVVVQVVDGEPKKYQLIELKGKPQTSLLD